MVGHVSSSPRPNIVLILSDEERAPPVYEAGLEQWRRENLPAQQRLADNGMSFSRHYTVTSACVPSRTSFYTGVYPSQHGNTSTYGDPVKDVHYPRCTLPAGTLPTMGDYFEAAGYETRYIGKWHISHEDLHKANGEVERDPGAYTAVDPLAKFGFHGWTGPEPHGIEKENSGCARDADYASDAEKYLSERSTGETPFLLAINFVNPHDISAATSEATYLWGLQRIEELASIQSVPAPPKDNLSTKPSIHAAWLNQYSKVFSSPFFPMRYHNEDWYAFRRRLYLALLARMDKQLGRVLDAIDQAPFAGNTLIVYTTDHGEMLGAHGGLCQKWYTAYDEALRIPWILSGACIQSCRKPGLKVDDLVTGSLDILPTLLGFTGSDILALAEHLRGTGRFKSVPALAGSDWSAWVRMLESPPRLLESGLYIELDDHISSAAWQVHPSIKKLADLGLANGPFRTLFHSISRRFAYDTVDAPAQGQAVVASAPNVHGLWKLVRWWDDPAQWTSPGVQNLYVTREGSGRGKVVTRTEPYPDEWELYNLTEDPQELKNVATSADKVFKYLQQKLRSLADQHRSQLINPFVTNVVEQSKFLWSPREAPPGPSMAKLVSRL